jgi:hypothetical protein
MSWRDRAEPVSDWRKRAQPVAQAKAETPEMKTAGGIDDSMARGFLTGISKSSTLGYLPQVAGTVEATLGKVGEALGLSDPRSFSERKQDVVQRFEDYEKQTTEAAPISAAVGNVAGYIAPGKVAGGIIKGGAALTGLAQAAPRVGAVGTSIAKAAGEGALIGGAQFTEGDAQERLNNAIQSGLTSGVFAGAGQVAGAMGEQLKKAAQGMRIKGAGAMLKDFRNIFDKGQEDELASFLKDKKIVGVGSTVESVAKKAKEIQTETGKKLGELYNQAKAKLSDPALAGKISSADAFKKAGFAPKFQKDEIISFVKDELGDEVGAAAGVNKVAGYLDELATKYGDEIDIVSARQIKSAIDRSINYARNPLTKDPVSEQAMRSLRKYVSKRIDDQIELLDSVYKGTGKQSLKQLNKDYANATLTLDMATDKFARENANRLFGLSEQLMGGAAGVGYGVMSGDPVSALGYGLLGAGASRAGKKFGPGVGAPLMEGAGGLLQRGGQGLIRGATPLGAAATSE